MTRRQIVLDTETTGLDPQDGHRIIEIGAVELSQRRLTGAKFHCYLNPERVVEEQAIAVHGLNNQFLADKPLFAAIVEEFLAFIDGAELIIHNAAFDVKFLEHELALLGITPAKISARASVTDTLALARKLHPGQKNSLDALCKRYKIDNTQRTLHGALLDAGILAQVYLAMTGGQKSLLLHDQTEAAARAQARVTIDIGISASTPLRSRPETVYLANAEELAEHERVLALLRSKKKGEIFWDKIAE